MAAVNRTLTLAALLLFLTSVVVCQTQSHASDCSTLKYLRHKASCLCGTVQICSGDICGRPSDYELDDDIAVELRDKSGTTLDTQKVVVETREKAEYSGLTVITPGALSTEILPLYPARSVTWAAIIEDNRPAQVNGGSYTDSGSGLYCF